MAQTQSTTPFAPFEWMLASRYLRARRKEGFISVIAGFSFLGIMLGVATLIIVMAVMNGFRNQLFEKILGLNGHAVVHKVASAGPFNDYLDAAKKIERVPGIRHAIPVIEGQVMVPSPNEALGGLVRGVSEKGLKSIPLVARNIRQGSIEGFDNLRGVAIGTRLANALGLQQGDHVTLVSPRGTSTPFGTAPRTRSFEIIALFEMGMSEYDRTMIFMPLKHAKRYFSRGENVDVIEVMASSPDNIDATIKKLKAELGPKFNFSSWRERNQTFFTVLKVEQMVMFIILSLIILVAALNIISGMMMLVKDKGRDIAILRTMGATKGAMMRVFLITGASIGVVGTIAGLLLGILFCWRIDEIKQFVQWITGTTIMDPKIYYLARLPAEMNPWETLFIVLMAFTLTLLATIYPSWRATKLDPVEALRYE